MLSKSSDASDVRLAQGCVVVSTYKAVLADEKLDGSFKVRVILRTFLRDSLLSNIIFTVALSDVI
jgi:hypothetical protein